MTISFAREQLLRLWPGDPPGQTAHIKTDSRAPYARLGFVGHGPPVVGHGELVDLPMWRPPATN